MKATVLSIAFTAALAAQQTVAPSAETVGRSRGQDWGDYNVVHSFETGYRFHSVGGNETRYRSDVNFGNGIRLLGANLLLNSREGHGRYFDELVINTQGLGNDPYQSFNVRLQHNKFYRYDGLWRLTEYQNPGLAGLAGGHLLDTRRQAQDHDFTLLPSSPLQLFFGYSRNTQDGPGLSSIQLFDARGDEFPLFAQIDRRQSEFRFGAQLSTRSHRFTIHRIWQRYEEAAPVSLNNPSTGVSGADFTSLNSFQRSEPYEGSTPVWRASLFTLRQSRHSINARFSYAGGRRDFAIEENSAGFNRLGAAASRQVLLNGSGRRPLASGAITFSAVPSDRLTLTYHMAFHQLNMDGDASYREVNNNLQTITNLRFNNLSIRSIVGALDANFRVNRWWALFGGFHASARQVRSSEGFATTVSENVTAFSQTNRLNAGLAGIRLQPLKALRFVFDSEIGRTDRPFFPISERNYHALGARAQYKTRAVTLSGSARTFYNTNSVTLSEHSSRSRNYTADASWTPRPWFALDAGYAKLHLDTLTGLAFFASNQLVTGDRSFYVSNIHSANLGLRFTVRDRVTVYLGYSRVQDIGDERNVATVNPGGSSFASLPDFRAAQTFPLSYQSPLGRLSIRLHDKLRWNVGYQHYQYREEFPGYCRLSPVVGLPGADASGSVSTCPISGNYRAHTGFTSVIWSF